MNDNAARSRSDGVSFFPPPPSGKENHVTTHCNRDDEISPGAREFPPTRPHLRVFHRKLKGHVWRSLSLCTQHGTREIYSSGCGQPEFERWSLALAEHLRLRIRGHGSKFYRVKQRAVRAQRRAVRELKMRTRLEREARLRKLSRM
jgi:hypothetical protein